MNKGLEALKSMWLYIDEPTKRQFALQDYKVITKELKALEIITKLELVKMFFNGFVDYEHYKREMNCHNMETQITAEEYDLLKQVLNEN